MSNFSLCASEKLGMLIKLTYVLPNENTKYGLVAHTDNHLKTPFFVLVASETLRFLHEDNGPCIFLSAHFSIWLVTMKRAHELAAVSSDCSVTCPLFRELQRNC